MTLALCHGRVNHLARRNYRVPMDHSSGIVDSHVHLLPGRLGEKVRGIFEAGQARFGPLAYPPDHSEVVARLATEGVDEIWTFPYAHKPGVAEGLNESCAGTVAQFAGAPLTVTGGATVHPGDDDAVGVVRRAVDELGLRVLKLHCSVGDFTIDDPRLGPVLAFCQGRQLPVVVHLGHSPNGRTEDVELPSIARAAEAHPDLPLILAHCGHHSAPEAGRLLDHHPMLHMDLTPVVDEHPNIEREVLVAHSDRILFGSDAPNTTLSVTECLAWLGGFGLTTDAHRAVTGGNARRLRSAVITA